MNSTSQPQPIRQLRKRPLLEASTSAPSRKQRKTNSQSNVSQPTKSTRRSHTRENRTIASSKSRKKRSQPNTTIRPAILESAEQEIIAEEDLCPICHLLLYQPVRTECHHRLCCSCMEHWTDVSTSGISGMVTMELDETLIARSFSSGLNGSTDSIATSIVKARCPMCRTQTSAEPDVKCRERLATAYPRTWALRAAEPGFGHNDTTSQVQSLLVYVGNRHAMVDKAGNMEHEWTFFIRPSNTRIVEEVQFQMYPLTRRHAIVQQRPPYEIRRTGETCFMIFACVILKAGYSWMSEDAVDSPDGAANGMLPLEWTLDFVGSGGKGSMGRCLLKVKNDREWTATGLEEERDEREWTRLVRAYHLDELYEPPEHD